MTRIVGSVVLLIFLLGCTNTPSVHVADTGKATPEKELIIGTVITLHSTLLREERPIIIALPDGYDTSRATYPVLYLTDGLQNIWHVMGTIEVLARTGSIPPLIVVGIQSTNPYQGLYNDRQSGSSGKRRGASIPGIYRNGINTICRFHLPDQSIPSTGRPFSWWIICRFCIY